MATIYSHHVKEVPREFFLGPNYAAEKDEVVKMVYEKKGVSEDKLDDMLKKRGYTPDRRRKIINHITGGNNQDGGEKPKKKGFIASFFS